MMKETTKDILKEAGFDVDMPLEVPEADKLTKEMKTTILNIGNISKAEIRTLVDTFYQLQDDRKAKTEQIRSIEAGVDETGENKEASLTMLRWVVKHMAAMEKGIKDCLMLVCKSDEVGRWLLSIKGIGPVLGAGLLAYFDIEGKEYASQFISYAGLNNNNRPWLGKEKSKAIINDIVGDSKVITDDHVYAIAAKTQWKYEYLVDKAYNKEKEKWNKEDLISACSMIPYNAKAKVLMWKVGKSFWWLKNDSESLYGRLYSERKVKELQKNSDKDYADQAAEKLEKYNIGKNTNAYKAYKNGELPMAHIDARCIRWVEKIFLSHLFEEMYRVGYNKIPPRYYSLAHLEECHNKEIEPEVPYHEV